MTLQNKTLGFSFLILFGVVLSWQSSRLGIDVTPTNLSMASLLLVGFSYSILLAIPFVPAIEIGILLMVLFGKSGILAAYLATIVGLNLSYWVGRFLSRGALPNWLIQAQMKTSQILQKLDGKANYYPEVGLILLFNLPSNSLIGGGGGIAMVAGVTKMISPLGFFATQALACAPLPLLLWLGIVSIESL